MGDKVQVDTVTNVFLPSGRETINDNFEELADEFDSVIYRDGSQTMQGDLDMDSNRIINLADALTEQEPVTLGQINDLLGAALTESALSIALGLPTGATLVGTSTGNTVQQELDLRPTSTQLAASSGSSLVGFIQAGTGTVTRTVQSKLRDFVNVRDFGAVGDNVADDTIAFQSAIDHVRSIRNGTLYIPAHNPGSAYKITAPLTCDGPINIVGASPDDCTIFASGFAANTHILSFNLPAAQNNFFSVSNVTFRSTNGAPDGIRLVNTNYCSFNNVQIFNVRDGITIEGTICFSNFFENISLVSVTRNGVFFNGLGGGNGNYKFNACNFTGDVGVFGNDTCLVNQITFDTCNFEQCVSASLRWEGSLFGAEFSGCRTEGCNSNDFVFVPSAVNTVAGISASGCFFNRDAGAASSFVLGGNTGIVRGFSITGNYDSTATGAFVNLNGEGESGLIAGNRFAVATATPINAQRAGVVVFGNENSAGKSTEYWGASQWGVVEGAFTPIDASGAGLAFVSANGRYTKIGRMVHWQAFVNYPATASGAAAAVGGLPFAISAGVGVEGRSGGNVNLSNASIDIGILQGYLSTTSVAFFNRITFATTTNTDLSGKSIYMSGSYMV